MNLFLKRSKIFIDGNNRVAVARGGPRTVPDWVSKTSTYSIGVKDGSILDLTPPQGSPSAAVQAKQEPKEETPVLVPEAVGLTEDSADTSTKKRSK